ncbi:MAG: adenylate/guanylate cyclase domain-containing protein, partial [Bacteroidetes bacterium]
EKIKTIGDAYMCVAGLPIPDDDNPVRAIHAALEILAFIRDWKAKKTKQGKETWDVRIGIHTGSVVAGVVGDYKFAYDIWGDAVNIASRMETSGEESKINISEDTYLLVKDVFNCTYRGELEAKNKGKVKMYFVDSIK